MAVLLVLSGCGGGGSGGSSAAVAVSNAVSTAGSSTSGGTATGGASGSGTSAPLTATQSVLITAPVISAQPQTLVVTGGQPAAFTVSATSTAAMTYQWSRAGTPIASATAASYTLPATVLADSGASFTVAVTNSAGTTVSATARLTVDAVVAQGATAARPFSDQSLWNAKPTRYTLGTNGIPTSSYFPTIDNGAWSVAAAVATNADQPMSVMGPEGGALWLPDAEASVAQIVIPHWPATVDPASGADGHADIIDAAANRIHSFWQLRKVGSQWRAAQYTWTALDGTGWGTPAAYMQGSRAAGVPTIAGVIRIAEVDDGLPTYRHALAMSLTYNALSPSPAFVFPATSADWDAGGANSGAVPEGALMMLPVGFDASRVTNPRLAKIVATLKTFGARVVDRNTGTPFVIYAEKGTNISLMPNGWDNDVAAQLEYIRTGLRQVTEVAEWVDATGAVFTPTQRLNVLSMRGAWQLLQGDVAGVFDTWQQAVVFPGNGRQIIQLNSGNRSIPTQPRAGQLVRFTVTGSGGAGIRLELKSLTPQYDSGLLQDGASVTFRWPSVWIVPFVSVASNATGGGSISATIVPIED